jgi:hypothetical protein
MGILRFDRSPCLRFRSDPVIYRIKWIIYCLLLSANQDCFQPFGAVFCYFGTLIDSWQFLPFGAALADAEVAAGRFCDPATLRMTDIF